MFQEYAIQMLMSFSTPAAIKIACLLLQNPEGYLPVTPGILSRLINCSYKSIKTGLEEMRESDLVTVVREGSTVIVKLNGLSFTDTDLSLRDTKLSARDTNLSLKDKNVSPTADIEEEDSIKKSSSSLLKSAPKSENLSAWDKNESPGDIILPPEAGIPQLIECALDELGMKRKFTLDKVKRAAEGLPAGKVREALEKCLLYNARSPVYVVKVLSDVRRKAAESVCEAAAQDRNLHREIELGELLLSGRPVKYETLSQSKHFRKFAGDLYDPIRKRCVITNEYRDDVEQKLRELEAKTGGG